MHRHLFALLCLLSLLLAAQAGYARVRGSGRRHPYRHRGGYGYGARGRVYLRPQSDRYAAGGHGGDYYRSRNAGYGAGGYGRPSPTQTPPCNAPCHPSYGLPGAEGCTCPGPEPVTTPSPRPETTAAPRPDTTTALQPETTTASPTADNEITIAFFAAKRSGGADFRRTRDTANASLPDDAVVMNYLVDTWSDFLSAGKLMITFHPYADIPSSPVTKTTVKDAKDFISTTYAGLPELPAGKDPSQYAVVKAYQSQASTRSRRAKRSNMSIARKFVLVNAPYLLGKSLSVPVIKGNSSRSIYSSHQKMVDDMSAAGKVLKDISTQANQLATVVAGSDLTAEDIKFYGDVGSSVSMVPQARMHLQELANIFTCVMCTLGDITLTPSTVTPTGTGPTKGADACAILTVTCANPGGTVFMQFNVDQGGPQESIAETVTAMLDCVNGTWVYAPRGLESRVITEVNCLST